MSSSSNASKPNPAQTTREYVAEAYKKADAHMEANPNFEVDHAFPFLLSPQWRCIERISCGARYERRNGLRVICGSTREADGKHWLHVSMSYPNRMPSYEDLLEVKHVFIGKNRTAYQIFPEETKHVNFHAFCLHLW